MTTDLVERLRELAEACENASGPDRQLDAEIARLLGFKVERVTIGPDHRREELVTTGRKAGDHAPTSRPISRYTASLDAAMTLVPEEWRIAEMGETVIECDDPWQVKLLEKLFSGERPKCAMGDGATPALALCAAALKARASQEQSL